MNYYERFPGDYQRDTQHLSLAEHGAYTLLMDAYYSTEHPLSSDPRVLFRICGAFTSKERSAVESVSNQFFEKSDDGLLHHKRIDAEIEKAKKRIDSARENGSKGGRPRKPSGLPIGNPVGFNPVSVEKPNQNPMKTHSGEALQTPHAKEDQNQKPCPAGAGRFADFWKAYPRHEDRKKAENVWKRKRLDEKADLLIADVVRRAAKHRSWLEGFVPHPTTYLNGERWQDDIDERPAHNGGPVRSSPQQEVSAAAMRRLA